MPLEVQRLHVFQIAAFAVIGFHDLLMRLYYLSFELLIILWYHTIEAVILLCLYQVEVTTVFGLAAPPLTVNLVHASTSEVKNAPIVENQVTQFSLVFLDNIMMDICHSRWSKMAICYFYFAS